MNELAPVIIFVDVALLTKNCLLIDAAIFDVVIAIPPPPSILVPDVPDVVPI